MDNKESYPIFKDLEWVDESQWKSYADLNIPGVNTNDRFLIHENGNGNWILTLLGSGNYAEDANSLEEAKEKAQKHFQECMLELYNGIQSLIK